MTVAISLHNDHADSSDKAANTSFGAHVQAPTAAFSLSGSDRAHGKFPGRAACATVHLYGASTSPVERHLSPHRRQRTFLHTPGARNSARLHRHHQCAFQSKLICVYICLPLQRVILPALATIISAPFSMPYPERSSAVIYGSTVRFLSNISFVFVCSSLYII